MAASSQADEPAFGQDGITKCLDPEFAVTGKYTDLLYNTGDRFFVQYDHCYAIKEWYEEEFWYPEACATHDEVIAFYAEHTILVKFFEKKTKIDFSKQDNYESSQMEFISSDYVEKDRWNQRKTTFRRYDLEMEDSIFNPIDKVTDEISYLQVVSTRVESQYDTSVGYFAEFYIDN